MSRKDKSEYKIIWIVMIMIVPLFGGTLYLMFRLQSSVERFQRRFSKYDAQAFTVLKQDGDVFEKLRADDVDIAVQSQYLIDTIGYPVYQNTYAEYIPSGEQYFIRLTEELKRAEHYIFLEYFIIAKGIMWDTILGILKDKVNKGVDVRVIYDDMGCMFSLPDKYFKTLAKMGIRSIAFNPFRPFWTTLQNNRDHRKIAVIDGKVAFTGGINLADEYINAKKRFGHWKDSAVMLRGDAVRSFTVMFLNMWDSLYNCEENFYDFLSTDSEPEINKYGSGYVQPYCDSPVDNEYVGENIYLQIIN
ncbi:MAG: phospholipase D-like domain-containing protein, partial [Eubacteriales bacterium]|nr:phospholipase D-like domain-containing protein [Eubacteriales bacterium]